jgi:zinc protease
MDARNFKSFIVSFLSLSLLLLLVSGCLVTVNAQEIKLPPIKKTTLDNGLKVIVIEHHELPVVAFRLVLRSGSTYDPSEKAGLANLTAGLLSKGTKARTATQIAEEIDFVGGGLGAGSGFDATFATCQVLTKHFDVGLELLSDIILNPTFNEEEIDRLKKQTLAAIKQQKDDPNSVAAEKFREFVFGNHPYGQPTEGTEESIIKISRDDIVGFHKKHYVPDNTILAVVGDVKSKEVMRKVESEFGGWKKGGEPPPPIVTEPPPIQGHQILLVDKPDLTQTYIRVGHLGVERKNPDYYAIKVMNYILGGGGFSSRLMDEIRVKRGLTYGIYCSFDAFKMRGAYEVETFTRNDSTAAAITAIFEQIERIRTEGVTDKELEETKSFYNGYFPLQFETPSQIATQILIVELYDLGEDYLENYRNNISAVSKQDVLRVAKQYLDPENLKLVVVSKADEVKSYLEPLGEVEVVSFLD